MIEIGWWDLAAGSASISLAHEGKAPSIACLETVPKATCLFPRRDILSTFDFCQHSKQAKLAMFVASPKIASRPERGPCTIPGPSIFVEIIGIVVPALTRLGHGANASAPVTFLVPPWG